MWELAKTPSHGGNSVRSIFSFVLTAVIAALLLVLFSAPALHAVDDQIHFVGNNLSYQDNQYTDAGKAVEGNSAGIPTNSEFFTFTEPISSPVTETDIIYFAAGKTPTTETSASFATYDTNPSNSPPTYSNPHDQKTISVQTANQGTDGGTSCAIQGIGWIICPVSNALAGGMDWLMGVLKQFVAVQPLNVTDTHNDLYVAWNIMRSIANVAFIIVFLIIIYSQVTNFGVSNYGLKKLLPRLIVGAVIVNLSYFICAIILDVSNILGSSLQDLLISMRTTVFNATGPNASVANGDFANFTTGALAGGTVAAGTVVAGVALNTALIGGTFEGIWYILVPALIALLLTVLVVVLILAARQALIIILIVISPIAFVAYLLPNTEKWFTQWRKTFTTMMVFYPAFSIVFAGSQLASAVIIKNAASLPVVVLGMIVQVAPLAITPWLLRLSGSTIQGVAKFAQGFNKRINGAVSGWAKPRREAARLRGLSTPSLNPAKRSAQYWAGRGMAVKDRTNAYGIGAENMYHGTRRFRKIDTIRRGFDQDKQILEKDHNIEWKAFQETNARAAERDFELRRLTDEENFVTQRLDARYEDVRGDGQYRYVAGQARSARLDALARSAQVTHRDIAVEAMHIQAAKNMQQKFLADALNAAGEPTATAEDLALLARAAGIDPNGAIRAQATAVVALGKIENEAVENTTKLLGARASAAGKTVKQYTLAIAESVRKGTTAADGFDNPALIEAAIETVAQDGDISVLEALRMDKEHSGIDQSMLSRVFARNKDTLAKKGGFHLQAFPNLANADEETMNLNRAFTLSNISAAHIADAKNGWYNDMSKDMTPLIAALDNAIANPKGDTDEEREASRASAEAALEQIYAATTNALSDSSTYGTITDRIGAAQRIQAAIANRLNKPVVTKPGDVVPEETTDEMN